MASVPQLPPIVPAPRDSDDLSQDNVGSQSSASYVEEEERLESPRADYFMNDEDDEIEVSAAKAFFIK